jgi:hypothetical protein
LERALEGQSWTYNANLISTTPMKAGKLQPENSNRS